MEKSTRTRKTKWGRNKPKARRGQNHHRDSSSRQDAGESKSDKGPASEERGKEVRLEELLSSRSEDVGQQVLETGLDALGGAEALERLSEGSDDEVDKTMELFLVEFKKACWLPYVLVARGGEISEVRGRSKESCNEESSRADHGQ